MREKKEKEGKVLLMLSLSEYLLLSVKCSPAASQFDNTHAHTHTHAHTLVAYCHEPLVCILSVDFQFQLFFYYQSIFDHGGSPNLMYWPGAV